MYTVHVLSAHLLNINCRSARDTLTKEFDENYDEYERTFSMDRGVDEDEPCELKTYIIRYVAQSYSLSARGQGPS